MWRKSSLWVLSCALALCLAARGEGAAPAKREPPPLSPADAVVLAAADILKVPPEKRCYQRYIWSPSNDLPTLYVVWRLHENLLSRYQVMVEPYRIHPRLWRISIDEPRWNPGTIENAIFVDVFFHRQAELAVDTSIVRLWPGGKDKEGKFYPKQEFKYDLKAGDRIPVSAPWLPAEQINVLRKECYSEAPILMAEWLFVQSARQLSLRRDENEGLGYYDFLQLKNRDDYFKLIKFNAIDSEEFGREFQSVLDASNVSPQNRHMFRKLGLGGGTWFTLDVAKQKRGGVALRNLRQADDGKIGSKFAGGGKKKAGVFQHDAEEWYSPLPNRLPTVYLSDNKGGQQAVAPGDKIGLHDSSVLNQSNDKSLHINLSCIQCHEKNVLFPFKDDVRHLYRATGWLILGDSSRKEDLEFRRLLLSDVYSELDDDRRSYIKAFRSATVTTDFPRGLSSADACRYYAEEFHKYATRKVSLGWAARELGVSEFEFLNALRDFARPLKASTLVDIPLSVYLDKEPGELSRLTWEDSYELAQDVLAAWRAKKAR